MTLYAAVNPYPVILNQNGGGLNGGKVYIGIANQDPETNPKAVYWDAGGTDPAAQPLVTIGGYIWNAGTPAQAYIDGTYSIRVRDRFDAQIFYEPEVNGPLATFIAELASTDGAGLVGLNQLTVYPENSIGAKLTRTLSLKDGPFNAKGDGTTDDTAAINDWLAEAGPGTDLYAPAGTYKFTAALDAITTGSVNVSGPGQLRYMGVSTNPGNLVSIGDGVGTYYDINWAVKIASSTVLTGGYALWIKGCQAVSIDCIMGSPYETLALYKGLYLNATEVKYNNTFVSSLNTGLTVDGGYEHHCQNIYLFGNSASPAGYGVHIGGGVGGFYSEQLTQQFHDIGCMVDTTLNATGNLQLFFETGAFDTNTSAGIKINDSSVNPTGKSIKLGCWIASTTAGPGLWIQEWKGGKLAIGPALITNNSSSGIYDEDPNCLLEISDSATVYGNTGFGIDAPVPVTIQCLADMSRTNGAGAIASNVTVRNTTPGKQKIVQDPIVQWAQDFTENSVTIANGANAVLPAGSGLIYLSNTSNGETGVYSCGGGHVDGIALATSYVSPTTTPGAGKVSIAYDGVSAYRIYNNAGATRTFNVSLGMTRSAI